MKKDKDSRKNKRNKTTKGVLRRLTTHMWLGWYSINKKTAPQL